MKILRAAGLLLLVVVLSGCASKFRTYDGPEVTRINVMKGQRQLYLMNGPTTLKVYKIGLGFAPVGDKKIEGDLTMEAVQPDPSLHQLACPPEELLETSSSWTYSWKLLFSWITNCERL